MMASDGAISSETQRAAVVDLGSNSVRMVVFEGVVRNPVPIFNEKATLRLGKGLEETGELNPEGVRKAMDVLKRFGTIARVMGAEPFDILATAAVRDARNGQEFIEAAKTCVPNARVRVLKGGEEADYSANGVLCALPHAEGLVADIGGGSLELISIGDKSVVDSVSTPLGVIRLRERAEGEVDRAEHIAKQVLADVSWLPEMKGRPLYLVGGAFRALARLHIAKSKYPINMVHLFKLSCDEARDMTAWISKATRKHLEKVGNAPRKRLGDAPFAAAALSRLIKRMQPSEIIFSAEGLREGWYMRHAASSVVAQDPMQALASEMAGRLGRNAQLPDALISWTTPLFRRDGKWELSPYELEQHRFACMVSDIGSYDHPQYRAEQTYHRILYSHGVGFDHILRAFVALVTAVRYEIELDHPVLEPSRILLDEATFARAVQLGMTLRLAYTLCAGTEVLLKPCELKIEDDVLVLYMGADSLRAAGGAVKRRLERLAGAMGLLCQIHES
ncbi:Ppx/GppA family phosphatase [Saccharibacter floricola]|uniref:Exopolyphosphatase n=1 Tax=Saccharibacter floricola DSM 15669 TaxID=1123227 RepID=A0ABQ0NY80_9PROT|nr:exopolyphosphatase [Saccharibacter floricola DSM 15669]